MFAHVERKLNSKGIAYLIKESVELRGSANYTLGIWRQRIRVLKNGSIHMELKQNPFLKLINSLPLINLINFSPFHFCEDGKYVGSARHVMTNPQYDITRGSDVFSLRLHSGNICSLTKNGEQVALYQKEKDSWAEQNKYTIRYSGCMESSLDMLFLICMLIDVTFFKNHGQIALAKEETSVVLGDKYEEMIYWTPIINKIN